jgi:hypothetical protein
MVTAVTHTMKYSRCVLPNMNSPKYVGSLRRLSLSVQFQPCNTSTAQIRKRQSSAACRTLQRKMISR